MIRVDAAQPIRYPFTMMRMLAGALAPVLFLFLACSTGSAPESEETLMKSGLDALYTRHEPDAAAARFRKVLELNPTHYGATYQLAAALDAAGKKDEARPLWEKVLQMADRYNDQSTARTARDRLAPGQP